VLGSNETVEIGEHLGAEVVELEVELPARAELTEKKKQSPPREKACFIDAQARLPAVWQIIEPGVEVGKEVTECLDERLSRDHGRPALRRRCWVWL
jgi:hypothetical protein